MPILRRLRAPSSASGRTDGVDRLTVNARTADAMEAWADRYGDAFIPVLDHPGERDVGVVRGLRGGVPFELVGWLDAPRDGEGGEDPDGTATGFTIELRTVAIGSTPTTGFRRRRPGGIGIGDDAFTAMYTGDLDGIGTAAREALLAVAAVATSVRFEQGTLVVVTRDPALRAPGLDPEVLDRLLGASTAAIRALIA